MGRTGASHKSGQGNLSGRAPARAKGRKGRGRADRTPPRQSSSTRGRSGASRGSRAGRSGERRQVSHQGDRAASRTEPRGRRRAPAALEGPPGWGGVARRGAASLRRERDEADERRGASRVGGGRAQERRTPPSPGRTPPPPPRRSGSPAKAPHQVGADRAATRRGGAAGRSRPGSGSRQARQGRVEPRTATPDEVLGAAALRRRLNEAAKAYAADRYGDAVRILAPLVRRAPASASARELYGLSLYRLGRWKEAIRQLEAFERLTGSMDQYPVVADCQRALGSHDKVDELWAELRTASPSSEVVAEGRLVAAGSLADRGRLAEAIRLLSRARPPKRSETQQLRHWYALADLHERAGDLPKARALFNRVAARDAEIGHVAERLAALG